MARRLPFLLATLFWAVMNYLLWQRDFQASGIAGGAIPVSLLARKVLEAPDASLLEVFHHKRRVGGFRWSPDVLEDRPTNSVFVADGMVTHLIGYSADVRNGTLDLGEDGGRVRFDFGLTTDTNLNWASLELRIHSDGGLFSISTVRSNAVLEVVLDGRGERRRESIPYEELRQPGRLAERLLGRTPFARLATGALGGLAGDGQTSFDLARLLQLSLKVDARLDWMRVGGGQVRAYKIVVHLPENRRAEIYLSRVGEILRVNLPDEIQLRNPRAFML